MKSVYCIPVLIIVATMSVFAELPDDEDLLLWIGEGSGDIVLDTTGNGNDGTFHGTARWNEVLLTDTPNLNISTLFIVKIIIHIK